MALIGNANSHLSRLGREKLVNSFNKSLLPLVKEDKDFTETTPYLFGADFAKRSKDFTNQIKAMRSILPNKTEYRSSRPIFWKGQPLGRGMAHRKGWRSQQLQPESPRTVLFGAETVNNTHTSMSVIKEIAIIHCTKSLIMARALQVQECPAGRLAHFQKNWALITRDRWVLDTVKGYHIELHTTPHQTRRPNPPQMSQSQEDIMQIELQK